MVIKTRFTELLGCKHPIVLAGMGPFSTYRTAVLVSNNGGVGLTSHWGILTPVNPKTHQIDREHGITLSPKAKMEFDLGYMEENLDQSINPVIGCNIRVARIQVDAPSVIRTVLKARQKSKILNECLKIIVTSAGNPVPPNKIIKKAKYYKDGKPDVFHFHVAPALNLCRNVVKAGCDGIIAVGYEGGGHQSYEGVCTSVLVPETRDEFPDIPIVAGGGMMNGKTLASALALGADAVQMGSRFIATSDGDFHINFKNALVKGIDSDTIMSDGAFGPIRLLKNKYSLAHKLKMTREERIAMEKSAGGSIETASESFQRDLMAYDLIYEGNVEDGAVLCGQTICGIKDLPTVAEVIKRVMTEAEETIKKVNQYID
ncbi:MAG: NAD(P)H-dependent flavin oxidoreductase [Candidatus Helarchaeota archaeon]